MEASNKALEKTEGDIKNELKKQVGITAATEKSHQEQLSRLQEQWKLEREGLVSERD